MQMKKVLVIILVFSVAALWRVGETRMTKPAVHQVPQIDMLQTGEFETATFALG